MDLTKTLKDVTKNLLLYSPLFGEVLFKGIKDESIILIQTLSGKEYSFTKEGKPVDFDETLCMLFPSKEMQSWDKFKLPRWRAIKDLEFYYYVESTGIITGENDSNDIIDTLRWKSGNYFKTKKAAKRSRFYKVFIKKYN
jgi:hypothetical protein